MRVAIVGASGTIGSAVAAKLRGAGHEVVSVGYATGEHTVDLSSKASIESLYEVMEPVDAVVCTAGRSAFGPVDDLTDADYALSIENKLMGQVNLVRVGLGKVGPGGSFTLTSGTLSQKPTRASAATAMVGGAVESFARAAALDLEGRYRLNVVSPGWVAESRQAQGLDPMPGIWAADLADVYLRFVEGDETGHVVEAERSPESRPI